MHEPLRDSIRRYIVDAWLNGDGRGLEDDSDLQHNGVLDSFTTLALAGFLTDSFQIELEPIDINAETFRSLNTLAELVHRKLSARAAVPAGV